jgi:hypothetical protein
MTSESPPEFDPTAYNFPLPQDDADKRMTFGLVLEVAEVLKRHGFPDITAMDHVDLQMAVFRFLYGPRSAMDQEIRERAEARQSLNDFGRDIAWKCYLTTCPGEDGHPFGTWSTGEQLAVAVVLEDREHLEAMGYTLEEASQSVRDRMADPPEDMAAWVKAVRFEMERTKVEMKP